MVTAAMKLKDAYINDKIMKSFPAFCDKWMDLDDFILCERNHLGKIKGITVEIGGDTTKLGKALKEVDK